MTEIKTDLESIDFELEDNIATVTIHGGKQNSFTEQVQNDIAELSDIFYELVPRDVRAIIITGEDDAFSSGGDMSVFTQDLSPVEFRTVNKTLPTFYDEIESLEIPTIAAINGTCVGGGLELAIACDLRIASDQAKFGFPENNIGLIPGTGGCSRFVKLVGYGIAKEMILTGEIIDASEAANQGLVNKVVPDSEVMGEAYETAEQIADRAPRAIGLAKRIIRTSVDTDIRSGRVMEDLAQSLLYQTSDHEEGIDAFLEKRDPEFEGR